MRKKIKEMKSTFCNLNNLSLLEQSQKSMQLLWSLMKNSLSSQEIAAE